MAEESATSTYTVAEPFGHAVQLVRKALTGASLRIAGELNMSERIQRDLLIRTAPCLVLFACPATAAGSLSVDVCEAAMTPLHVVISAHGSHTDVHILRVAPRGRNGGPGPGAAAVASRLQIALTRAIETIGMRVGIGA